MKVQARFGSTGAAPTAEATPVVARSPHRLDIQGLRAVLMIQVLLYHAWTIGSPIGVDAFIMISAYLLTSSFVRRSEMGQMPTLMGRWATTFKRLLPALSVTVVLTLFGSIIFLPQQRWREQVIQAFASLTYWENWRLVEVSADYYAADHATTSPFQHLWSMAMQGQMFLLWPLLMTVCVLLARRMRWQIRPTVIVAFSLLTVISLAWLLTSSPNDASVYFDTRSRIWEFAFGSAVAAASPYLTIPDRLRKPLSWVSLSILVLFCLVSIGTYPGPMAFIPLICVSVLLLFPAGTSSATAETFLSFKPLVALGNISYSVYLVHWPIFIFYLAWTGHPELSVRSGIVLILVSLVCAWLLAKLLEDPIQQWPWSNRTTGNKLVVVALSLLVGMSPILALHLNLEAQQRRADAALQALAESTSAAQSGEEVHHEPVVNPQYPGALAMVDLNGEYNFTKIPLPAPPDPSKGQWASFGTPCSDDFYSYFPPDFKGCSTTPDFGENSVTAVVAGSSHAEQNIIGPLVSLAERLGWDALGLLEGGCYWLPPEFSSEKCLSFDESVHNLVEDLQPDYVFIMVTVTQKDSPEEYTPEGTEELIRKLTDSGIVVFGVRDNPRSETNLYECSAERPANKPYGGCLLERESHLSDVNPAASLEDIDGFHMLDFTDIYCNGDVCPTIIGNIHVYLDTDHVSFTFAESLAPLFGEKVRQALNQ